MNFEKVGLEESQSVIIDSVCDTEAVIIAICKVVLRKSGARTIDCAMNVSVIVWSIIFILSYNDLFTIYLIGIMP